MAPSKRRWIENWRRRKRSRGRAIGDSPERAAERGPKGDVIDFWLKTSGVERESRFKRQ